MRILLLAAVLGQAAPALPPQTPGVGKRMANHFTQAKVMRTAVITGDLALAKDAAGWLARTEWSPNLGPKWRTPMQAMQKAAAVASQAPDLAQAAEGLGQIGAACAACHLAVGGPQVVLDQPPRHASGVRPHMGRHDWAAARMWDGLIAPDEEAWNRGTEVLADAPLERELGKLPEEVRVLARRVHSLGTQAHQAEPPERPALYGKLVSTCAACHRHLGPLSQR